MVDAFNSPVWRVALAATAGYAAALIALFVLLFVLPFLAFATA